MIEKALAEIVALEFRQRDEEGGDVRSVRERYPDLVGLGEAELIACYEALQESEERPGFEYVEPSDWEGIQEAAPGGFETLDTDLVDGDLFDRLHGGWLGRCVACMLGKPCEILSKSEIEHWLKQGDAYPLSDYFPRVRIHDHSPDWLKERFGLIEGWTKGRRHHEDWRPDTLRGSITRMVRDDDIDYPIMRLDVLEDFGLSLTSADIAESFTYQLPYRRIWSAERCAYRNVVNNMTLPDTATYLNPHREAIGATTRADLWGYVFPGQPGLAVELAFRDAHWSHTKNGIYGELFAAAMISAAFSVSDVEEIVGIGLKAVPSGSRLAEAIRKVIEWRSQYEDWQDTWAKVNDTYGHFDWAHTIPNVCWIVMGLLYGKRDFEKSICLTVMCGMDTDSSAATVGSVLGVMRESHGIPDKFKDPLNDRVESFVVRNGDTRISELARRTLDVVRQLGTNP